MICFQGKAPRGNRGNHEMTLMDHRMVKCPLGVANNRLLALLAMTLLCACTSQTKQVQPALSDRIGRWENIHEGNLRLAGVCISQYPPDGHGSERAYENKHPGSIWYMFWDGAVQQTGYDPDGLETENFYWKDKIKPGSGWWDNVDFSYGSDPNFERHKDPRKVDIETNR